MNPFDWKFLKIGSVTVYSFVRNIPNLILISIHSCSFHSSEYQGCLCNKQYLVWLDTCSRVHKINFLQISAFFAYEALKSNNSNIWVIQVDPELNYKNYLSSAFPSSYYISIRRITGGNDAPAVDYIIAKTKKKTTYKY